MTAGGARELAELCAEIIAVPRGITVTDISLDSRTVVPGGLFLACAGRRTHGLAALPQAIERGARAVLWEPAPGITAPPASPPPPTPPLSPSPAVPLFAVPKLGAWASRIADRFFAAPSAELPTAGITGTNGKTTTAWLVACALTRLGHPAAYLGTLGTGLAPGAIAPGEYTTADAVSVQRQLAAMRAAGARYAAMEVSSHALDQQRVAAVRLRVAAFTNLTRDHLDYHGTMEAYGAAKAQLFALPELGAGVLNVDDRFGAALAARLPAQLPLSLTARTDAGRQVIDAARRRGAGIKHFIGADCRALPGGLAFALEHADERGVTQHLALELPLLGEFNVDNALIALAVLAAFDIPLASAATALAAVSAPPGRMQPVLEESAGGAPRALAIIDYAHTPDALAKALQAARAHCRGRLHVVFGCGGDRDAGKRPLMARVAAELADVLVITDDNPRTESPTAIVADIRAGLPPGARASVIHDRAAAIAHALEAAVAGEVVLVAGKGHEDYQIIGNERRAFSDLAVIRDFRAAGGARH